MKNKLLILLVLLVSLKGNACLCILDIKYPFPVHTDAGTVFFTCEQDNHCYSNEKCLDGFCFVKCKNINDCEEQQLPCREKLGQQICHMCFNDNECLPDEKCLKNVCRKKCAISDECQAGYLCNQGFCKPKPTEENNEENMPADAG